MTLVPIRSNGHIKIRLSREKLVKVDKNLQIAQV